MCYEVKKVENRWLNIIEVYAGSSVCKMGRKHFLLHRIYQRLKLIEALLPSTHVNGPNLVRTWGSERVDNTVGDFTSLAQK